MDGGLNPKATYGGAGPVMGFARFSWRKRGEEWADVRYVAGLTEKDARASLSGAYAAPDAEFLGGEWLTATEAEAQRKR